MDLLGNDREVVENKLVLLYIINKFDIPVSNKQITKLLLDIRFMNYFIIQQFLNELHQANFLTADKSEGRLLYKITPSGKQTLEYLSGHIPAGIRKRIDGDFSKVRAGILNKTHTTADFTMENGNLFIVTCKAGEQSFPLVEMNIAVGTKNDARNICDNWKNHSGAIYSEIIDALVKKRG